MLNRPTNQDREEINEIVDQLKELTEPLLDQVILTGKFLYDKMTNDPQIFVSMAKCYKVAIAEIQKEGFTREEAFSLATLIMNNLGKK